MSRKIYVASSWRNEQQADVVAALRAEGHEVYDFKNPEPGNTGFGWRQCSEKPIDELSLTEFANLIVAHPVAQAGFKLDRDALHWCDTCVMVLPCGRSAHLEAGYAAGQGKETVFLLSKDKFEPELMYLLGDGVCPTLADVIVHLRHAKQRCSVTAGWDK